MNENFAAFLGEEVATAEYSNGSLVVAEPQLITDAPMSRAEAEAKDRTIIRSAVELGNDLLEMQEREGWKALRHPTWEAYLASVAKRTELSRKTLYNRMQVSRVRRNLCKVYTEEGNKVPKVSGTHAVLLAKLPDDAQADAVKRAQAIAADYEPEGRAADFHFPGKVLTHHIEQAVEEIRREIDPYADEEGDDENGTPANVPMKQGRNDRRDFFSEQNRAKPLPPQETPTDAQEAQTEEKERELADYEYAQTDSKSTVVFVGFSFEDGREGEVWIPKKVLTGLLTGLLK